MANGAKEQLKLDVIRQACEADPLFFTRYFFKKRQGIKFIQNWHHKKIADALLDVEAGKYDGKVLIINVPPGSSKTEMVVINWIARSLAVNPRSRFLHLSYSDSLAELNSMTAKDIVLSDEYQALWPRTIQPDSKSKKRWNIMFDDKGEMRKAGGVYATSMRGQITGFRAGHMADGFQGAIVIDDAISPDMAESLAERNHTNDLLISTIKSRRATPQTPVVMIMQRLHELDPTGFIKNGGITGMDYEIIKIPAIMDGEWDEESYWEYKEPINDLREVRDSGSMREKYVFWGQYMQEPAPVGNGEFSKDKIQFFDPDHPSFDPSPMNVWILYDPANDKKKKSDYTAMVALGLAPDNNYYILDIVRDKLNPTERVKALMKLHRKWNALCKKPPRVAVEQYGMMTDSFYIKKAQEDENYRFGMVEVKGSMKKEDRIRRLIPHWEDGQVYIRSKTIYRNSDGKVVDLTTELIEDELMMFPVGKNDDMIDALTRIFDVDASFPKMQVEHLAPGEKAGNYTGDFNENDLMSW